MGTFTSTQKKVSFFFLLILITAFSRAQVSVTATAATLGPTSYTTVSAALSAINAGTHKGDVTIKVNANTTEPAAPQALYASGISTASYTSVTIKPGAAGVIINSAASPTGSRGIIDLLGADNVTIDGSSNGSNSRDLTIQVNGTTNNVPAVRLEGGTATTALGCNNITIKNLIIVGNSNANSGMAGIYAGSAYSNATTSSTLSTSGSAADYDNVTIQNNDIRKCFYGIYFAGTAGNPGDNLKILDNYLANTGVNVITFRAIYVTGTYGTGSSTATAALIQGNNISTSFSTGSNIGAVEIAAQNQSLTFDRNKIHDGSNPSTGQWGYYGILLSSATVTSSITLSNNMIWNLSTYGFTNNTDVPSGIFISAAVTGLKVYYNTIRMNGAVSTSSRAACININSGSATLDVRNNILSSEITGGSGTDMACIYHNGGTLSTMFTGLDYNDYYFTGNNKVARNTSAGTNYANFAAWKTATGKDGNSLNVDPNFVSATDPHLLTSSGLNAKATAIAGITTDIDGETRNATVPDIGADEIFPVYNDAKPVGLSGGICSGTQPVVAIIKNIGLNTLTSVSVTWSVNGVAQGTINFPSISVASGAETNLNLGNYTFVSGTLYTLQFITSLPNGVNDENPANDYESSTYKTGLTGTYTVGSGGNFSSLTVAVTQANLYGICGPTVFSLTDATYSGSEVFPIVINSLTGSSAVNTLTIKPASGNNATITGSATTALIKLNGADYIIIDGSNSGGSSQNLVFNNTNSAGVADVWIASASTADGATNNTVKNTKFSGVFQTTVAGILAGSGSTAGNPADAQNSANTVINNTFISTQNGMYVYGAAANDANWVISGNTFGSSLAGEKLSFRGLLIANAQNFSITGNTIAGVVSTTSSTANMSGIQVAGAVAGGTIAGNKISDIKQTNTTGYGALGINLGASTTTSNLNVYNNFISDVAGMGYGGVTVSDNGYGIVLTAGGGYNIDFNTVSLATNQTTGTPAAINITSGIITAGSVNLRNNIFSITSTVGTRYAIYCAAANTVFGTINYNDYYSAGTLGYIGSNRTTLAAIQTGFGQNVNSLNVLPVFVSASDLHVVAGSNTALNNTALSLAGITTDIDGDVRCPGGGCPGASSAPDFGADEFVIANDDAGVTALTGTFCPGNQPVQVVVKNYGLATLTSVNVTWSINGVGQGTVNFPSLSVAPGATTTVTLGSYNFVASTNYTLVASTSNPSGNTDQVPGNDAFTSATFQTALSGTYTVGSGGNFTTLTAAVAAANAYGLCGPTVFSLTDATYSGSETFPLTINSLAGSSSVNTLTIKPATGVNAAITGSVATGPMIKILNSNTIVEGSNNGSLSRNLTITNTGATSPNILLVGSTGTTAITNVTLKNFIAKNGSQDYTGIFISDAATVGNAGYFNNITVQNLDIRNSYVGVFANATVAAGNGNNTKVLNCLLNNTGANAIGGTGIALAGVDGGLVSGNDIGNFESDYGEVDNGILLGAGTTNTVIEKNIIHDLLYTGTEGYGAKGITVATGLSAANVEIRNNMIRNITGDGDSYSTLGAAYNPTGIYLSGASQAGVNIYYNTIYLYGNTLDYSSNSASVGIGLDDGAKATIKNNIIRNELGRITYGVGAYAIAAEISSAQITGIDYNDYYVASNIPSGNYIGRIGSNNYATLAAFQTASGGDANSKNIMPNFVSSTNLHMVAGLNISLNNLGTTIGGITTDIDGDVRGASPDMGADEFTPVALDAAATVLVSPSGSGICGVAGQNIVVQISNFGTSTLTSIPVTVSVSGPVSQVFNATYTGSLASGASTNFTVGAINMNVDGGTYIFNGQTSLPGDQNTANDAFVTVNILTINPAVNLTVTPSPVCLGQPATLNATATSGGSFNFANSGSSGPVNLTVTDNSTVGASSTINLTGTTGTVSAATTVKVTLNINHLWVEDLDVFLVDPTGTRAIELTTDNGADGEDYVNTVLQTGAANNINTVTASDAPFTATYAPEGTVSTGPVLSGAAPDEAGSYAGIIPANPLVGAPLTGNWTLRVFDDYGLISGTLVSWSLEISGSVTGNFTHAFTGPGSISAVTYSGIDNATGEVTLTNTPAGSQPFNVVTTGPSGCSSSKNLNVQVNTCTNTWQGDVAGDATNWFNSGNWSLNYVPNVCGADVVIPTSPVGGVFPVIDTTSPAVGNVTVQSNANITINAGKNISVCGNWIGGSGSASQILGAGVVVLNGSSSQQLSGKTQFQNLQLNNATGANMQAGSRFEIFGEVALQSGTLSTGSGQLVFRSTSDSQIGIIDNFSPGYTGTISGTISAERYYHSSATYDAHFMGSPVDAPALSEFATGGTTGYAIPTANCDETQLLTGSPYGAVASMDESVGAGCAMKTWKFESTATPAQNAKGYSVRKTGAGVITVNGNPNLDASYAVNSLNNTGWPINTSLQGRPMGPGWHLISNPYLANLDISSTPAGFDVVKLVWINDGGGSSGTYQPATVVAPFQAFMVHRIAPGAAPYTVNATQRTKNAANYSFQKQGNDHELTLTAINNGTQRTDVTKVAFNSVATVDHDPEFDCIKIAGALDRHTLYTYNSNPLHWTAINTLNSIEETSTVNVGFEPGINGSYTLQFDGLNTFDPTSYITLEDKKLNVFHDVRSGNYGFTASANDDWNRFVLHFTPAAKFNTTDATCAAAGQVNIEQPGTANWNYVVTNGSNVTISSGVLNNSSPVTVSVPNGVYTVTLTDNNNYTVVKNVLVNGVSAVTAAMNVSKTTAEEGEEIDFVNTSSNATSVLWEFGDGANSATTNASHTYSQPGVYNVKLTVSSIGGCVSSTQQTVTVTAKTSTGITDLTNGKVTIWSHANMVYVDFSKAGMVQSTIDIYNILGQVVSSEKFGKASIYSRQLNNLDAGYVIVSVKSAEGTTTKKVFISNSK
ncbi:MAG: PKD domain-containing protein [Chitinophagales bacterium]